MFIIEIHSTFEHRLDRAIYDRGTVNQPLKDWTGKKNLHFSGDWLNEKPKVTNGENTWLRDYEPAREVLINSGIIEIIKILRM